MQESLSFREAYRRFWKRTFDYRGSSGREEYWIPVTFHIILLSLAVSLFFAGLYFDFSTLPAFVILAYLLVTLVPGISLTVRRLHDTGRKGVWAWLLLAVGAGTVIVLLLCSGAGSGFDPFGNAPVSLYGPPPWESDDFDPSRNETVALYGPPEWFESGFDPSRNENEDVYGPPEWFNGSSEETPEEMPESFDPSANIPVLVYGPPEWFESRASENSEEETLPDPTTGLPFDPSQNVAEPLYGPPAGTQPLEYETR